MSKLRERVALEHEQATARRAAEAQRKTLAELCQAIIAAKRAAGRKPSTIEAYSYWLRIHIVDFFGPTPVDDITRDDVRAFSAALDRKGLAPKSRANALGTLHSLSSASRSLRPLRPTQTSVFWRLRRSRRYCEQCPMTYSAGSSA